ncbi:MAG: riboflavin synthase [Hyphomonadaceae bacterium]|nr:riboflavin synthase [Hyphomonadaceae bacterium]MBC6411727.1 riboflavin synthase [Hyphomonadaceae bacterium]
MFTGIITDIGTIRDIRRQTGRESGDTRVEVYSGYDFSNLDIGTSVSHSGACMTIVEKNSDEKGQWFGVDVSDESLSKTTMGDWAIGEKINLERALTGKDELGGHLVTGHVDGVGTLVFREEAAGSLKLTFAAPTKLMFGIASKGSITIDGVSLTVNEVFGNSFTVNIIPYTADATTLGSLQQRDKVNLEIDLIARYVARYLENIKGRHAG